MMSLPPFTRKCGGFKTGHLALGIVIWLGVEAEGFISRSKLVALP